MRQHLTTVIEVISIVTALGVVVSALVYSIAFAQFGLSYIAIASLADILRDSLRLLILVIGAGLTVVPLYLFLIPHIAQGSPRQRMLASILFGFLIAVITLVSSYVVYVVSGLALTTMFEGYALVAICGLGAFASIMIFAMGRLMEPLFRDQPYSVMKQIREAGPSRLFALVGLGLIASITLVYIVMLDQLEKGLQMRVHFSTLTACPGERRIVAWMGDTKAVIKCEKSGRYEVKVLS